MATASTKTPALSKTAAGTAAKKTVTKKDAASAVATPAAVTKVKKAAAKPPVEKAAAKKVASGEAKPAKAPAAKKSLQKNLALSVSPEHRYHMIATAAYFLAERRGFAGGYEMQDWISAEAEVDAGLNG